jgi:hypothetical protein
MGREEGVVLSSGGSWMVADLRMKGVASVYGEMKGEERKDFDIFIYVFVFSFYSKGMRERSGSLVLGFFGWQLV